MIVVDWQALRSMCGSDRFELWRTRLKIPKVVWAVTTQLSLLEILLLELERFMNAAVFALDGIVDLKKRRGPPVLPRHSKYSVSRLCVTVSLCTICTYKYCLQKNCLGHLLAYPCQKPSLCKMAFEEIRCERGQVATPLLNQVGLIRLFGITTYFRINYPRMFSIRVRCSQLIPAI